MNLKYLKEPWRVFKGVSLFLNVFGLPGLYFACLVVISRRRKRVRVAAKWAQHPLYLRLNSSDLLVFKQVFIEGEYSIIDNVLYPLNTVIDAGANIGLTSAFIAERYPVAQIHAIEPDAGNFEMLELNTKGYPSIRRTFGALWDRDEPVTIELPQATDWAFRVSSIQDGCDIRGFRLSTFLELMDIERVSLLKMDIEGAEYEVLSDGESWINRVDNIVIELHDRFRPGCTELFEQLITGFDVLATGPELTLAGRKAGSPCPPIQP